MSYATKTALWLSHDLAGSDHDALILAQPAGARSRFSAATAGLSAAALAVVPYDRAAAADRRRLAARDQARSFPRVVAHKDGDRVRRYSRRHARRCGERRRRIGDDKSTRRVTHT